MRVSRREFLAALPIGGVAVASAIRSLPLTWIKIHRGVWFDGIVKGLNINCARGVLAAVFQAGRHRLYVSFAPRQVTATGSHWIVERSMLR